MLFLFWPDLCFCPGDELSIPLVSWFTYEFIEYSPSLDFLAPSQLQLLWANFKCFLEIVWIENICIKCLLHYYFLPWDHCFHYLAGIINQSAFFIWIGKAVQLLPVTPNHITQQRITPKYSKLYYAKTRGEKSTLVLSVSLQKHYTGKTAHV